MKEGKKKIAEWCLCSYIRASRAEKKKGWKKRKKEKAVPFGGKS